ncbi:MAG: LPS export ABC transporter periplasmic protein LptC [Deltaproteobacteria bacterium]|nr:LPS export ABC transporter periplasmic protein LptC [Deltaproteobacteria bacterium]
MRGLSVVRLSSSIAQPEKRATEGKVAFSRTRSFSRPTSALGLGVGCVLLFSILACDLDTNTAPSQVGDSAHSVVLMGVRFDRFEQDILRYRAQLRSLQFDRSSGEIKGAAIEAMVLDSETRVVQTVISAPVGRARKQANEIVLSGGVQAVDRDARTLATDAAVYLVDKDLLTSTSTVTLLGDNFTARGRRLHGHPKVGRLEIEGPLSARVVPRHALRRSAPSGRHSSSGKSGQVQ